MILEGVTQGDPLMMVLYGIILSPLKKELRDADPTLLSPFYANDAMFDGSERRSMAQLRLLMDQGPDRGYFLKPAKSLFISDNLEDKGAEKREFRAGKPKYKLCRWQPLPGDLFGDQGGSIGVGAAQGGGMVPRGTHLS